MELQIGDIVLVKGTGFLSRCVRFFTNSQYSHVAMLVTEKHIIEANWYKKANIVEFKYNPKTMEIYRLKGGLDENQKKILLLHAYDMLNSYYDYFQIFGYVIGSLIGKQYINPFNSSALVICSELIDRAYLSIGIDLVPEKAEGDVVPKDISKSFCLERIY